MASSGFSVVSSITHAETDGDYLAIAILTTADE